MPRGPLERASDQLAAAVRAPLCVARLPPRTWALLALYAALATGVLGAVAWAVREYEGGLRRLVLSYVLPESWQFAAEYVVDRFFAAQQGIVLTNAIIAGSLALVTVLLFYVKELVSLSYEQGAALTGEPVRELPLWMQAWEEIKLFLLFLAVQGSIFWIGYGAGEWRAIASVTLSYAFLFYMFAIDFLSPVMQRHQGRYSTILKTLARRPVACVTFGAMFAAPTLIAGAVWPLSIEAVFAANVASIAWAAVAGTWLGARLMPAFRRTERAGVPMRAVAWLALVGLLAFNGYRFGALTLSVHHKSQILKCDYDVDLGSFGVDAPSLAGLLDDDITVGVHFDVTIHNPTRFDVEIEDNRVELRHDGALMGTTRLSPVKIPAGATVEQTVKLSLDTKLSNLGKGLDLLDPDDWSGTLYVKVAEHFEFPIALFGE
jgi:hypothetical protein